MSEGIVRSSLAPKPQSDEPPSIRILNARGSAAIGRGRGRLPGEPEPVLVDRDRLTRERLLAEVDVGLPAILELLQLAIVLDGPGCAAVALARSREDRAVSRARNGP